MSRPLSNQDCLVVRLSSLGDVLLTTGVLEFWRHHAGLHFYVLTKAAWAPLFDHHPAVRETIAVDQADLHGLAWPSFCRTLAKRLGSCPLIDLHGNPRTRILRLLWPGPVYAAPKFSWTRRLFLATRHPLFSTRLLQANVPQRYHLALGEAPEISALRPCLFLHPTEVEQARAILDRLGMTRPIAIHPYASHTSKTPRPAAWKRLLCELKKQGENVLILGRNPTPLFPDMAQDLTNTTDLRTTAALLSLCRCLISSDSGPMHLSTAVSTPVLALFGPTTREWGFFPCGAHDIILQTPCPKAPCSLHGQTACALNNACLKHLDARRLYEHIQSLPKTN